MLELKQTLGCAVNRTKDLTELLKLRGKFIGRVYDKDGAFKYEVPGINDIVNEGKNELLDIMFSDGTQIAAASWYIGLISLSGFSVLAPGDTMASHAGWTEYVGYTEAARLAWGPGAPASQSITNAAAAVFNINATGTVKGIFVTTQNTKGGATGKLWATGLFTADVAVVSTDQLRITYTVSC